MYDTSWAVERALPQKFFTGIGEISQNDEYYNKELADYYDQKFRRVATSSNLVSEEVNHLIEQIVYMDRTILHHTKLHYGTTITF